MFVYSREIKEALDSLVEYRTICGIAPENNFLFANSVLGYIGK